MERGDGQPPLQLNDSTVIVSAVAAALGVEQDADAAHWRAWVDDHLVHLLPANIYRTPREALASFDYLLDSSFEFGAAQRTVARYVGAIVMFALCRLKLNKKYNITDPRGQLYAAVDAWVTGLAGTLSAVGSRTRKGCDQALQSNRHLSCLRATWARLWRAVERCRTCDDDGC